jgi:LysR family transcriptional regulator, low CO2-responsive transcriptional regulator
MEIKQLKAFLAIADTGTFTAGAREMHVTQAAISMQIRQLEDELGLQLFTRTPRQVILTEAGERLIPRARRIIREAHDAIVEIAELGGTEHGRLRIGSASAEFTAAQLPVILRGLREIYPRSDLSISVGTSQMLVERILNGDIDIAFVSLPVENNGIVSEMLFSDEIVAIGHPSHPLASKRSLTPVDLGEQDLILGERGGNTRRMIDDFFEQAGVRPKVKMELSRQEAIDQMVESQLGVGTAGATSVAPAVRSGRLVAWTIDGADIRWQQGLARIKGGYFSPIAKAFFDLCKESFATRERSIKAGKMN